MFIIVEKQINLDNLLTFQSWNLWSSLFYKSFFTPFFVITCIDTASSEQSGDDDNKENRTDEMKSDHQQGCVL